MSGKKPTHRLVMKDEYTSKDGEKKINRTEVMPLWENDKGGLIIRLPKGMLLSGTLFIFKNEEKTDEPSGSVDDDLPF